jgi:AcrR family transcriptional regulator
MGETARVAARDSSRVNQKARTRAALVAAAVTLVREGRPPSIPDAAAEALVSVATAYRYFTSAEDLWAEASLEAVEFDGLLDDVERQIEAAGDDVMARAEVAARVVVGRMLEDQLPFRQLVKAGLEQWFAQRDQPEADEHMPIRAGRRNRTNRVVVEPLRGTLTDEELERLVRALALLSGTDAMLALTDTLHLDAEQAMITLLDANRWLLAGALAESKARRRVRRSANS